MEKIHRFFLFIFSVACLFKTLWSVSQPVSKLTQLSAAKKCSNQRHVLLLPITSSSKLTQTQKTTQLCQARPAAYPHTTLNLWFCFDLVWEERSLSLHPIRAAFCAPSPRVQHYELLSVSLRVRLSLPCYVTLLEYPCCFLLKFYLHRGRVLKAVLCSEQKRLFFTSRVIWPEAFRPFVPRLGLSGWLHQ